MPKYRVRIAETIEHVVDVEAESPEEAEELAVDIHTSDETGPDTPEVTNMGVAERTAYAIELDADGDEITDEEE